MVCVINHLDYIFFMVLVSDTQVPKPHANITCRSEAACYEQIVGVSGEQQGSTIRCDGLPVC